MKMAGVSNRPSSVAQRNDSTVLPLGIELGRAERFLSLLAGDTPVTFQTFRDNKGGDTSSKGGKDELALKLQGPLSVRAAYLQHLNRKGAGVFVMVNEGDGQGRKAENVSRVRALFVDLDGAPLDPVQAAPLKPHLIVESSPDRFHCYWLVKGVKLEAFRPAQKFLAKRYGGDETVCDLPRVMRLPGFLHLKGEPFTVTFKESTPGKPYTPEQLEKAWPGIFTAQSDSSAPALHAAPSIQAGQRNTRASASTNGTSRRALAALDSERAAVLAAPEGKRNNTLNTAAFNLGQLVGISELAREEVEDELMEAAMQSGLSSEEAAATIKSGLDAGMGKPRPKRNMPEPKAKDNATVKAKAEKARPEVTVNDRYLRDISGDALDILKGREIYTRAGLVVRVNDAKAEPLTEKALKGILERAADFVKVSYKAEGEQEIKPSRVPKDVPADILSLPEELLPFPKLTAIARSPVLLPSGELLMHDGYDPDSGILLKLEGLSSLRHNMTVREALTRLDDLIGEFPFVDEASRAHTLCMLIQPTVRHVIKGPTPLYMVDAPLRGAGKGLLIDACILVQTGSTARVMPLSRKDEEIEKRVTALLLDGSNYILLDNVTGGISSGVLAAVLTAEVWQGRVLGESRMLDVRNEATWVTSGNNIELSDEITRRAMPIRLDPGVERPEERKGFKHPKLKEWARAHRAELLSAVLSIVKAWADAGMPKSDKSIGSYESWAGVMGGILEVAGVPGLLGGRERLHTQAEQETNEWSTFLAAWFEAYEGLSVTAHDLLSVLKERHMLLGLWGGRSDLSAMQRLGRALKVRRDRIYGGFRILTAGQDGYTNNNAYRLEQIQVAQQTPETTETPPDTVTDAN